MDLPPIGNNIDSGPPDLSPSESQQDKPKSVVPNTSLKNGPSEPLPRELSSSQRRVSIDERAVPEKPIHTWNNREPLIRFAPGLTRCPPKTQGMRCTWNFQKDISELSLRPAIRKKAREYTGLDTEQREAWLDERMAARTYAGNEFPALQGQQEVKANRDIRPFEILGHYAGEINTEKTLAALKKKHGISDVVEYLVDARLGYCISALEYGNVCSLINANQLHVDKLNPENPIAQSLNKTVVPANTALMPISHNGNVITFVISITEIPKGHSVWLDYGPDYWIDQFSRTADKGLRQVSDSTKPVTPDADSLLEASEEEIGMEWLPEDVDESDDSSDDFIEYDQPPPAKRKKYSGQGDLQPVAGRSYQPMFSPLTPEQSATAVNQAFQEETYQLNIQNKKVALCTGHDVPAGQVIGEIKGRACYITQLPSGKMVAFQDWYGRPILLGKSETVVMLGCLSHSSEASGSHPVYQGFILEGCHRFLTHSHVSTNCDVELHSVDHPDMEVESDDGTAPIYGKDALLKLVSTRKISTGSRLFLPSGIFPAFTADVIDDPEEIQAFRAACSLSMKSSLTEPIGYVPANSCIAYSLCLQGYRRAL